MKTGWEYKKIGDILQVERGGSPRPIKKYLTDNDDGLNWIKISDATASSKYIYETKQKITKEGLHKTRLVKESDFLLSNSMSFGRPYIMKTTGCIHDGWLVLREKDNSVLDKDFLYHLLGSPYIFSEFDKLAAGSTVRNLNISLVSSVSIPIPPLAEQQQIVAILDKAFAAIDQAKANIEQNIANAEELFQSKLNAIFSQKGDGWVSTTFSTLFKLKSGDGLTAKKMITGQFPVYGGNGISGYHNDYNFESPQVIIGRVGAWCGNVRVVKEKLWLTDNAFRIANDLQDFDLDFLVYLLNNADLRKYARQAAQPVISNSSLKDVIITYPLNKKYQKEIVIELDLVATKRNNVKKNYHQKLTNLEELKKSLLQKAFAGELT